MDKLKIFKVRDVKTPERGTPKSAGIDFFIPADFERKLLFPREDILIPSGIIAKIPEGYMLMAADKSGIAPSGQAKMRANIAPKGILEESSLIIGAKIIDEDYPGEIHIHLINTGSDSIVLAPDMKVAQFILVPVLYADVCEVDNREDLNITGERIGGFGSTNNKK